jgi:hypothetical protein
MNRRRLRFLFIAASTLAVACLTCLILVPLLLTEYGNDTRVYRYYPDSHHHGTEISWQQKMDPSFWLGNNDDPEPPVDYLPGEPDRLSKWYFRNPFHNFTFYVIGIADKEFERKGRLPDRVFDENGGWNWAVSHYGIWRLPFISYKDQHMQAYWGWRDSGNFGMKLNLFHSANQLF